MNMEDASCVENKIENATERWIEFGCHRCDHRLHVGPNAFIMQQNLRCHNYPLVVLRFYMREPSLYGLGMYNSDVYVS